MTRPPHGAGECEEIPAGACPVVWLGYWEMFAPAFLDSHPWIAEEIREQTAHMNGRGGGER